MPSPSNADEAEQVAALGKVAEVGDDEFPNEHKVSVVFEAEDGAAELYLIDRTYSLIAQGGGTLAAQVAPGIYKVRQRAGYEEKLHTIEVTAEPPRAFTLPRLPFPSPIPLLGTTLIQGTGLEDKLAFNGEATFRLLLWTPYLRGDAAKAALNEALGPLRLETFDGTTQLQLKSEAVIDEAGLCAEVSAFLSSGAYVLVQAMASGRQRCLPVWISPGMVTAVYLLAPTECERQEPVDLEHAAIVLLNHQDYGVRGADSLRRLEVARKALSLGRNIYGWSCWERVARTNEFDVQNPILDLIDTQLAVSSEPNLADELVTGRLSSATQLLGTSFPDVAALTSLAMRTQGDAGALANPVPGALAGPPLLRRSWAQLLATPNGDAALAKLMPFKFQVEGSGSWFVWSEDPGARNLEEIAADWSAKREPRRISIGSIVVRATELIVQELGLAQDKSRHRTIPPRSLPPARDSAHIAAISYDELIRILATLVQGGVLRNLLEKVYQAVSERVPAIEPSLQRLVIALEVLHDQALVRALGAETLARQALSSLGLPRERVQELVKTLLTEILSRLTEEEREVALKTLMGVVAVADVGLSLVLSLLRQDAGEDDLPADLPPSKD